MTNKKREKIINEILKECRGLRATKGIEYSNDADINANFKSDLDIGISPEVSCMVFANKHYRAIRSFIKSGTTLSENIEGRIADLINYLLILGSLIRERDNEDKDCADRRNAARKGR
jgi:hypothetical protein